MCISHSRHTLCAEHGDSQLAALAGKGQVSAPQGVQFNKIKVGIHTVKTRLLSKFLKLRINSALIYLCVVAHELIFTSHHCLYHSART